MPLNSDIYKMDTDLYFASDIRKFYSGSTILLTGATGFVGKVLLEKILRSCPSVKKVYIIIRKKKDKQPNQRLDELFKSPIFEPLFEICPTVRNKVQVLYGDLELENWGISTTDRETIINEVNFIFHCAANVRFEDPLRNMARMNLLATREMLQLAQNVKNLKCFIHVSTAFSFCTTTIVKEKLYDIHTTSDTFLETIKDMSDKEIDLRTPEFLGKFPNAYVFTKALAEESVVVEGKGIPRAIIRPSMVISTHSEPIPGWIDNYYGPIGVTALTSVGLLHISPTNSKHNADMIPVDFVANTILAAAWDVCVNKEPNIEPNRFEQSVEKEALKQEVNIYNCTTSYENPLTWGDYSYWLLRIGHCLPSKYQVWKFWTVHIPYYPLYVVLSFIFHIIPAYFFDFLLVCTGRKPMIRNIFGKIDVVAKIVKHFSNYNYVFVNENVISMNKKMSPIDKRIFYCDVKKINWHQYFYNFLLGGRKAVLKEKIDSFDDFKGACIKHDILEIVHWVVVGLCLYGLYRFINNTYQSFIV